MKVFPILVAMTSLLAIGCSGVTDADLEALRKPNAVLRKETVIKIADGGSFRIPLVHSALDRDNEKEASEIMAEALRSGKASREMQLHMLEALAALEKYVKVPTSIVVSMLKSADMEMQDQAIRVLAKIKHKEAIAPMVALLEAKEDRYPVIWALGEIGDPGAIDVLNKLLVSDDRYVRYNAHGALAKIGASQNANTALLNWDKAFFLTLGKLSFCKYQTAMANLFNRIEGMKRTHAGT